MKLNLNKAELTAIINLIDFGNCIDELNAEALISFLSKINMHVSEKDSVLENKVIELLDEVDYFANTEVD